MLVNHKIIYFKKAHIEQSISSIFIEKNKCGAKGKNFETSDW